jgi:two-component system cell cycle response regulator
MESSKTVVTPHRAVVSHLGRRIDRSSCTRRTDDTIGPYGASMRTSPTDPIAVLLHLTQTLGEDRTLEDALLAVTDAALVLVDAKHASVRLLDAGKTALLSGARSGAGVAHPPLEFRRGDGIIGWAVEHRESVLVDDAPNDPRFLHSQDQGFAVRSLVVEPLWSSGDVIGVLSVSSPTAGAFDQESRLKVRLLANCSVPPIEKARLRRLAIVDDLTLAFNVRHLLPCLQEEMAYARRTSAPLSFLLLDLDHFKRVNDAHGHAVGDAVLRHFADRVRERVRRADVLVRRGGEEFALVMPTTTESEAKVIAERIQETLALRPFTIDDVAVAQTVSIGVATWDGDESPDALERRADLAMYEAKDKGRNAVVAAKVGRRASRDPRTALPRSLAHKKTSERAR